MHSGSGDQARPLNKVAGIGRHLWDYIASVLLVVLALYLNAGVLSPVRFDQESIEVWANENQIEVRGLYHYRNLSLLPASLSFGLPFPVDHEHDRPGLFSIAEIKADGKSEQEVVPRLRHGDVVFRLFFASHEEKWVCVHYFQHTRVPAGTYILRTTRAWGRPLDHGDYTLHLGSEASLASSNYSLALDSSTAMNTYKFSRKNFYPAEDWNFAWREPAATVATNGDHQ